MSTLNANYCTECQFVIGWTHTMAILSKEMQTDGDLRPISPPPTLQARRQALTRDAIWDAAIDLFAQKGFDETTIDDIAQAAGVSRRSFFRYFSSKNDLMAQGIITYGAIVADGIAACPPIYSSSELLREVVLHVARHSASHPRTRKIMEVADKYPAAREAQVSKMSEVQDRVAEAFARGSGTACKDEMAAHLLAGLTLSLVGVTFRSWFAENPPDISVTVDRVLATLNRLLCVDQNAGATHRNKPGRRKLAAIRNR